MRDSLRVIVVLSAGLALAAPAFAAETITYTYDAKGRLTKVVKSGTVNNGVTVDIKHDKADNRTQHKTTGA